MLRRNDMLNRLPRAGEVLAGMPGVQAAYVFGSVLDESRVTIRDVDFAVLTGRPLSLEDLGALLLGLEQVLGTDCIDLVDLRGARRDLRFEVLSSGRLLFERDATAVTAIREQTLHEHLATRHLTRLYHQLLRQEYHRSYARAAR